MELQGKVALVTGAGSGIGAASALLLARAGARVGALGHTEDELQATAARIRDGGGEAMPLLADVASPEEMGRAVERLAQAYGRLDIAVANAGINGVWAPIDELAPEEWDRTIAVNLRGTFLTLRCAVPWLKRAGGGSVVIVSSIGGLRGSAALGAYAISKAADMQLARNLACEYGKHNIRVNCIAPGLIKTDFAKALWDNPETLKASTARSPLLRIGVPDEIAGAAVLMGSKAGDFMTGQTIVIDGGATIS
jgi:NAD(P)-dependent dehydrogenase (short-subunit alcohol dehydrogenase family)